jgi:DNA-binding transcriptional ArsR family regulator
MNGEADIARVGSLVADPARARMLMALGDGRALAASVLADEAGVAASTASAHLAKLVEGGLLTAQSHGRHRYFALAGPEVGRLIETLAGLAPPVPVRSPARSHPSTRAHAVRTARTCYDHLAGRLGAGVMAAMLERGLLAGGDGIFRPETARGDRLSSPGSDVEYRLTELGLRELSGFGIDFDALARRQRPLIRSCMDWSEQRHHLAGSLGAALAGRLLELGWVARAPRGRAVLLTPLGAAGLARTFGLELEATG